MTVEDRGWSERGLAECAEALGAVGVQIRSADLLRFTRYKC